MRAGALAALTASILVASPALAQPRQDAQRPAGTPELPHCDRPVGSITIEEPKQAWWTAYNLSSPESLLKLMASRSNCLRVVDRGRGMQNRQNEEALARSGELQRGSNVGLGTVRAADYALIPDLDRAAQNAGGNTAALGTLFGKRSGVLGALAGGFQSKTSEAHVLLTLVNIRTTEQEYVAEGTAQKTNWTWGAGGFGGVLAAAGGGYSNTDIGQVIAAAYLNAFTDLIHHLQDVEPGSAKESAPIQTYVAKSAIVLRSQPSPTARVVRQFSPGDSVFPTGQKNGVWWEVDDENGNRGWVSSVQIGPK